MFGKPQKKFESAKIDTLIGRHTHVKGDVSFSGGLHVEGKVTGNVTAEDDASMLILSENGQINGEVHVPNQVINGMVEGDVYASEHIELATKARIQGNVYYNLIEMAVGAEINGNLVHQKGGKPKLEYKQGQPAGEQHEQQAAGGNS